MRSLASRCALWEGNVTLLGLTNEAILTCKELTEVKTWLRGIRSDRLLWNEPVRPCKPFAVHGQLQERLVHEHSAQAI